jgi:predicted transcriptional regulator
MNDQPRSLKYRTLQLLKTSTIPDRELAKTIGISIPWIRMFRDGDIKSPNVDTVQRLYEFLAKEPLFKG